MNFNQKIKLLYLSPQCPYPPIDGGKISIYYPLKYLAEYFDILLIFPISKMLSKEEISEISYHFKQINVRIYPFIRALKGLKIDFLHMLKNFRNEVPFKWDKYYSDTVLNMVCKIIREEKINYIWVSAPHMALYAVKLKRIFSNLTILLREHNLEFMLVKQYRDKCKNLLVRLIADWQLKKSLNMEKNYWRFFDKVIFISDLDYEIASKELPEAKHKFEVIYDGYEIIQDRIKLVSNSDFIYTANLSSIQNHYSFRWFLDQIWKPNLDIIRNKDIKLYITGNNKKTLAKFFKNNNEQIKYNIVDLGFIENINHEITKYKYVLSPTILGSGLRLKLLNGMSAGKPVFITPLDLSTVNFFSDLKNVVCFSNSKEFVNKLELLERNPTLYMSICDNAIKTIREFFNWNKYAIKVFNIIMKIDSKLNNAENA